MKTNIRQIAASMIICSVSLTACQGYQSSAVSNSSGQIDAGIGNGIDLPSPDATVDMDALNADIAELNNSMSKLDSELNKVSPSLGVSGVQTGLDKTLRSVFDKLFGSITKVIDRLDALEAEIQSKIGLLDPNNLLHIPGLEKLREALNKLNVIRDQLLARLDGIKDKLNGLVTSVDKKVAAMNPRNPLSLVASIAWLSIRKVLVEHIDKIMKI